MDQQLALSHINARRKKQEIPVADVSSSIWNKWTAGVVTRACYEVGRDMIRRGQVSFVSLALRDILTYPRFGRMRLVLEKLR
jgi:hypothetical protein